MSNINNYDPAIIAEKIKAECVRQDVTIKTMLKELNIGINAINQINGGHMPRVDTLARICDYLNISIDALLDRAAPATPAPPDLNAAISTVAAAANLSAGLCARRSTLATNAQQHRQRYIIFYNSIIPPRKSTGRGYAVRR